MSIADKITRLQNAKTAIANAITGKGGTVASGDGFEDFATDIGTIPSGGQGLGYTDYIATGLENATVKTFYDSGYADGIANGSIRAFQAIYNNMDLDYLVLGKTFDGDTILLKSSNITTQNHTASGAINATPQYYSARVNNGATLRIYDDIDLLL